MILVSLCAETIKPVSVIYNSHGQVRGHRTNRLQCFFFFFSSILPGSCYHRTSLALPPSSQPRPHRSHKGLSPPPPHCGARAFVFIASTFPHPLPSSTRVEWYLPTLTLLDASVQLVGPFLSFMQTQSNYHHSGQSNSTRTNALVTSDGHH